MGLVGWDDRAFAMWAFEARNLIILFLGVVLPFALVAVTALAL